MDIAIISEHASPLGVLGGKDAGGQNVYVAQLARHLHSFGHKVEIFTRRESNEVPIIQEFPEGFKVINVPAGPVEVISKEELLPLMDEFTEFMVDYINSRSSVFDVIHANFWMSGLVALDLKKIFNIPFFITFHALGKVRRLHQGSEDKFPDIRFSIEEKIAFEADGIFAECPQDMEDLISLYNAPLPLISIVPCGFDPEEIYPVDKYQARSMLGIDADAELILHLGRMVPRKGADNIIKGFSEYLDENTNIKSRLLIVGGENDYPDPVLTPELGRLMHICEELEISDKVIFVGRKKRNLLKLYYSAADVFVTTPWYEPFGITPVEAMACGTPVIGSAVGGIKYTIEDETTGLLVPPNNASALKMALGKILRNEQLKIKMGRQALERVNRFFRWETMARQIENIFSRHVDNKIQKEFQIFKIKESIHASSESTIG